MHYVWADLLLNNQMTFSDQYIAHSWLNVGVSDLEHRSARPAAGCTRGGSHSGTSPRCLCTCAGTAGPGTSGTRPRHPPACWPPPQSQRWRRPPWGTGCLILEQREGQGPRMGEGRTLETTPDACVIYLRSNSVKLTWTDNTTSAPPWHLHSECLLLPQPHFPNYHHYKKVTSARVRPRVPLQL